MKKFSYVLLALFLCAFVVGCSKNDIGSGNPNPPPEAGSHDEEAGDDADPDGGADPGDEDSE